MNIPLDRKEPSDNPTARVIEDLTRLFSDCKPFIGKLYQILSDITHKEQRLKQLDWEAFLHKFKEDCDTVVKNAESASRRGFATDDANMIESILLDRDEFMGLRTFDDEGDIDITLFNEFPKILVPLDKMATDVNVKIQRAYRIDMDDFELFDDGEDLYRPYESKSFDNYLDELAHLCESAHNKHKTR